MSIESRIAELGITLPEPAKAVANYVPFVQTGSVVHISGQLSNDASGGIKGTVGVDVTPEQAAAAARLCGINLLAQIKAACDGDLDRVVRIVKLGGFVQAGPDFDLTPHCPMPMVQAGPAAYSVRNLTQPMKGLCLHPMLAANYGRI